MRVKFKTKEQFINGLIELKKIGATGEEICIGTSMPVALKVDDIISGTEDVFDENPFDDSKICEFSIDFDDDEYRNVNFEKQYGLNHIFVSITTEYDVKQGDVSKNIVSYDNMIEETIKMINEHSNS